MKTLLTLIGLSSLYISLSAQQDTLIGNELKHIVVKAYHQNDITSKLSDVHGTYIVGGRKSEVLQVQDIPANIAEKTGRQVFAKVPGAFVYDMDGSGNQLNIATRGLDPHRSWEFNVRQNDIIINSDIFGYPASHYSPPLEAIKTIEIIRGTAALQYGAEFGGLINYVTKEPDTIKPITFESINSAGSYGLFSTYNSLSGKIKKFTYLVYAQHRYSDGYRDNGTSNAQSQFVNLNYQFSAKHSLKLEVGRSQYLYRIPGPLTDSMFYADPTQATRSRNYFSPDIYVPSLTFDWKLSHRTSLQWVASGVFGNRSSVEFEGFADRPDVIDPVTLQYKNRNVNIDNFNSRSSEIRLLHQYNLGKLPSMVSASVRYFNNDMRRRQLGKGTTGSDYDLSITGDFGRDLRYKSQTISIAVENMIYITPAFTVSPGFRYETGASDMTGYLAYYDPTDIPNHIKHNIPAFGINTQYRINNHLRLYGGISQAYRPVVLKDIIPTSGLEQVNKDLEDAFGYNAEAGINGKISNWLKYEATYFRVIYNNRLGSYVLSDQNGPYIYRTNIGDSETNGVELFAELVPIQTTNFYLSVFSSTSWMNAEYKNASVAISATENKDISGNQVESVPNWISRNGLNVSYKAFRVTLLYSYVDESFADPANTVTPSANGAKGIVPAYGILDLNMSFRFSNHFNLRFGLNNLTDKQYFTKRPLFYPGPGVWSSDGRGFVLSFGVKF